MASAIHFLDDKGKRIVSRDFRGDIPISCVEEFSRVRKEYATPCFNHKGINYMYIEHSNIIVLAVAKTNINAISAFVFLQKLIEALESYVELVEEESVRDNFVIIYELLDEMADYGFVQVTDVNILRDYVTQSSHQLEVSQALSALTDKVSWRPSGIYYKKNELFVDVSETSNFTIDAKGNVLYYSITGKIFTKSYLSGMPVLKLGLNDIETSGHKKALEEGKMSNYRSSRYVKLQDVSFHQCVSLDTYEEERTVRFVPPDGAFELMTYRIQPDSKPSFSVETNLDIRDHSRVLISCKIKANYKKRFACTYAEFAIPVPQDCDSPRCRTEFGSVLYAPERQAVLWRIKNFNGGGSASMEAELQLSSVGETPQVTAPVSVKFEILGLAPSGLEIRFLKVTEDILKYQAYPWVRYLVHGGTCEVRLPKQEAKVIAKD